MRPGMQCLLAILRGQEFSQTLNESEWDSVLALAAEEQILPWVAARLRPLKIPISPAISDRLSQIERDAAIAEFYWSSELASLLSAFSRSSIRIVPLKGPFLAERLYGSATLRACRDLDLLVSRVDLPQAEAILSKAGFVPGVSDDYHRAWTRRATIVELHHDVENPQCFDFNVEGAMQRAQPSSFQGQPCWELAPEDELRFLCLHAARHRFERLSLLVDLQLAFERLPVGNSIGYPRAEVASLGHLLTLGMAMARRFQPDIELSIDLTHSTNPHLDELADRLWKQLLTQTSTPLNWRRAHAFFLEVERPGWPRFRRRCRHLRILASRVIEPDYEFASRLGLHRAWQVRMLRPFRLVSDSLHGDVS